MRSLKDVMLLSAAMIFCALNATAQTPAYVSLNAEQFQQITYTWPITNTDAVNQAANRVGNLTDVIYVSNDYTDESVAQAIALIRKVYMDPRVPGIWYRGYTRDNGNGTGRQEGDVAYQAVGQIQGSRTWGFFTGYTYNYSYVDAYGWNIAPDANHPIENFNNDEAYARFNQVQFKPNQQGYTVLLIEIKNSYNPASAYPTQGSTPYENLCRYFAQAFKSVRVLTQSVRANEGQPNAGTLFKLNVDDCDQFFLVSKGQARRFKSNDYWHPYCYTTSSSTYYDKEAGENNNAHTHMFPFYHMFEQFSPTNGTGGTIVEDVLQKMKKGETPTIVHDCISVFTAEETGHGFKMTGQTGQAENVEDLMFLIPDRRLTDWNNRGNSTNKNNRTQDFVQYNNLYTEYQPTTGIYAIILDGTATQTNIRVPGVDDPQAKYYKIDLNWSSNLYKFLSAHQQKFLLYYITKDEQGNDVEVPVKRWDEVNQCFTDEDVVFEDVPSDGTIFYTDYVPMESHGKEVTYMVKGIDISPEGENFLKLHPSNKKSFFISGYDKHELLHLAIHANYKSTFDPQTNKNYYTNEVPLSNASGETRVSKKFLTLNSPATTLHFKRKVSESDIGVDFAVATLTALTDNRATFTITTDNQDNSFAWHKANQTTINCPIYTANEEDNDGHIVHYKDEVDFSNFILYDNFSVTPDLGTDHRNEYVYMVEFTAAEPFVEGDDNKEVYSNMPKVPVFKTDIRLNEEYGHTREQVDADTDHSLIAQAADDNGNNLAKYTMLVTRESSTQEVHDVTAYSWLPGQTPSLEVVNGNRVIPSANIVAHATNQGAYYQITPAEAADVNDEGDNTSITFATGQNSKWGHFNYAASEARAFEFVPVVETIAHDKSHNTYGAPTRTSALGKFDVEVYKPTLDDENSTRALMSNHTWTDDQGNKYAYYNIFLNITNLTNSINSLVPEGYSIYKIRAWRKVDPALLGEQLQTRQDVRVTESGEYMFEEMTYGQDDADLRIENLKTYMIGERDVEPGTIFEIDENEWAYGENQEQAIRNEMRATFGARKLKTEDGETGCITSLDAEFIVRMYFVRSTVLSQTPAGAPRRAISTIDDTNFYIVESRDTFSINANTDQVITGLGKINANCQVQGVTYYNTVGIPSQQPWSGVNIVVTRYTDGSTTTTKIVR